MTRRISATEAKNKFGQVIKQVYVSQEPTIVEKGGLPVVVIVSIPHYESNFHRGGKKDNSANLGSMTQNNQEARV
jgi:prevent-host-death family protein